MKTALSLAALALSGCAAENGADAVQDPSKMSDALEQRAADIEEKADQAVLVVEREAQAELNQLKAAQAETDANQRADAAGKAEAAQVSGIR